MGIYLYFRTYWGEKSQTGLSGRNVFANNKMELVETCIKSLELESVNIHTCACVDNSTDEYTKFLESVFDEVFHTAEGFDVNDHRGKWPVFGGMGNLSKVHNFILKKGHKDDDVILILEDDYLFRVEGFRRWISACGKLEGFVSPFDHPDRYLRNDDIFFRRADIHIIDNMHFRTIESNTSVVGGRYIYFRKSAFLRKIPRVYIWFFWPGRLLGNELPSIDRVFYRRAYFWLRIRLYSPIPGLCTHLSRFIPPPSKRYLKKGITLEALPKTQLSPGVDWEKRFYDLRA